MANLTHTTPEGSIRRFAQEQDIDAPWAWRQIVACVCWLSLAVALIAFCAGWL